MLLRFGFSNFRSIKGYQDISFLASPISDDYADLLSTEAVDDKILPALAIYGGNATGKSNLLKALDFICIGILNSHRRGDAAGGISRDYFLLDKTSKDSPSLFDCDFIIDNIRYHYGFVIDSQNVLEEWLYSYPKRYKQVWFHRKAEESKQYYFGKSLKGKNRAIEALTRGNSLFLSCAAQNNHEMLTPIYKYFKDRIEFDFGRGSVSPHVLEDYLQDESEKEWLIKFLTSADIGIVNVKVESVELEDAELHKNLFGVIKEYANKKGHPKLDQESSEVLDLLSKGVTIEHSCSDGSTVEFTLDRESLGTKKLIAILGPIYEALKKGTLLVIDEIDTSMHPLLSMHLIKLFQFRKTNPNNAQLMFSTHDTTLLGGDTLRRDQIWFTEKDREGSTVIFPLTDISTRKGDNISSGYLQGRYGAIPYLGNLDALFEQQVV